jgi:hypothetical protein
LQAVALEIAAIIDKRSLEAAFYSNFVSHECTSDLEHERRAMVASFMSEYTNRIYSSHGRRHAVSILPRSSTRILDQQDTQEQLTEDPNLRFLSDETKSEMDSFAFDPFANSLETLRSAVIHIYSSLQLLQGFSLSQQTLYNFVCNIESSYVHNPYHNWYHGFSVCHVTYLLLTKTSLRGCLSEVDVFALMVATMCHDVGHDGRNNDFHIKNGSELAIRYNDVSVLENMHAATTFKVIKEPNNNIFSNILPTDVVKLRKRIIANILCTDMAHHMDLVSEISSCLTTRESFDKANDELRNLLSRAICHSADLSNPILPFDISLKWANFIAEEFNAQAMAERAIGREPAPHMEAVKGTPDHARTNLGFLDYVVFPLWKCINEFLQGELEECIHNLQSNREEWARRERMARERERERKRTRMIEREKERVIEN